MIMQKDIFTHNVKFNLIGTNKYDHSFTEEVNNFEILQNKEYNILKYSRVKLLRNKSSPKDCFLFIHIQDWTISHIVFF